MMSPLVDEIGEETEGLKVGKVNVDEEMELARKFRVMSIPTFILFKDGEVAKRATGAMDKNMLLSTLLDA